MKNFALRSVLLLTIFTTLFGCSSSSDSEDPEPTCTTGFTGPNCDIQKTPTAITITKMELLKFPNSDGTSAFDFGSNPDVYIKVNKGASNLFSSTTYYEDALGDGSTAYTFTFPTAISSMSTSDIYAVSLYDYDSGDPTGDDFMNTLYFSPYTNITGFPTQISFTDLSSNYKIRATVSYTF